MVSQESEIMSSNRLSEPLTRKAVKELFKFESNGAQSASTLIEDFAKPVLVQLQLVKTIAIPVQRPIRVKIPHTLYSPGGNEEHTICLFCRSEDKESISNYIAENPMDGNSNITVLSLADAAKVYKGFKDRRELLIKHTYFVCDSAILSHLYNVLGKVFSQRNNFPIPITIKQDLAAMYTEIRKVVNSTYIHLKGQHVSLRLGNTSMSIDHVVENIREGLEFAISEKIPSGWSNIHSIHIKTPKSPSLPLYYKDKNELMDVMNVTNTSSSAGEKIVNRLENTGAKKRTGSAEPVNAKKRTGSAEPVNAGAKSTTEPDSTTKKRAATADSTSAGTKRRPAEFDAAPRKVLKRSSK